MADSRKSRRKTITTRTGDTGETSLLYGQRVSKAHPQVEACGVLDEVSASLAMAKATCESASRRDLMEAVQRDLIALMGEVSTSDGDVDRYLKSTFPRVEEPHLDRLEREIEALEESVEFALDGWAVPGKNLHEAALEVARANVRRAERRLATLKENGFPLRPILGQYLNRLSDLLWLLAREAGR